MAAFDSCLKTLPAKQGRAFVLRNWMEEETDTICDERGVTADNLAVLLHRARTRLRAAMQQSSRIAGPAGAHA
jgi:RNA polymerase sigma-70 factor (ECF subfamily)